MNLEAVGGGDQSGVLIVVRQDLRVGPSLKRIASRTVLGHAAVQEVLSDTPAEEPQLIGMRENRVTRSPLMACVKETHAIADVIAAHDYEKAMDMRGSSFKEMFRTLRTCACMRTRATTSAQKRSVEEEHHTESTAL